jgi:hypothetical protein
MEEMSVPKSRILSGITITSDVEEISVPNSRRPFNGCVTNTSGVENMK